MVDLSAAWTIYRGRRYVLIGTDEDGVWLKPPDGQAVLVVAMSDPDLILKPTPADLEMAEAFERGDVDAFEYPDGHLFPSGGGRSRRGRPGDDVVH